MSRIAPELFVILAGLALLAIGLCAWLGWPMAAVIVGAFLTGGGAWSAAQGAKRGLDK